MYQHVLMTSEADVAKESGKIEKVDEPKTIRRLKRGYNAPKAFSLVGPNFIVPVPVLKAVEAAAMMATMTY
ncbi:hypothetical protein BGX21_000383 [Mortierella sp. AD011]|nr:hypothetical protein BGX20_008481 [Mortierella sp. AD010]KAF9388143.1 hypothetical protein BGX21_000383 [Mortierella sp. AD011]